MRALPPLADHTIRTRRLLLQPLTAEQLRLYLRAPHLLEHELSLTLSRSTVTPEVRRTIGAKLSKLERAPASDYLWYTFWLLIIYRDRFGAGLLGFKGKPNLNGEAEIGYGIEAAYRRRGYMTEAVTALIRWGFQQPDCTAVLAETHLPNIASRRVLEKVGMNAYRETAESIYWRMERP